MKIPDGYVTTAAFAQHHRLARPDIRPLLSMGLPHIIFEGHTLIPSIEGDKWYAAAAEEQREANVDQKAYASNIEKSVAALELFTRRVEAAGYTRTARHLRDALVAWKTEMAKDTDTRARLREERQVLKLQREREKTYGTRNGNTQ